MPKESAISVMKRQAAAKRMRIKIIDLRNLGCFKRIISPLNPQAIITGISAIQKFITRIKNVEADEKNPVKRYALVTMI